jgi:hypothetical protein
MTGLSAAGLADLAGVTDSALGPSPPAFRGSWSLGKLAAGYGLSRSRIFLVSRSSM